jgi:hypothetical protein
VQRSHLRDARRRIGVPLARIAILYHGPMRSRPTCAFAVALLGVGVLACVISAATTRPKHMADGGLLLALPAALQMGTSVGVALGYLRERERTRFKQVWCAEDGMAGARATVEPGWGGGPRG